MVIWIVGLSGSGKTTLGRVMVEEWRKTEPNVVLLDGDEIRKLFLHDQEPANYSVAGRRINAERMLALCEWLDSQHIHVVCCILSIFPAMRAENRQRFSRYFEVFVDASMAALESRDGKGLYAAARAGKTTNVVGVDIPFPRPTTNDLTIDTSGQMPNMQTLAADVLRRSGAVK